MASSSMLDYWKRTKRRKAVTPAPGLMTVDDYFSRTPRRLSPAELIYGAIRLADAPVRRDIISSAVLPDFVTTLDEILFEQLSE
jgi:hypothetical protein